jgi:tRNA G18 (ribose-2'-O)-methylase SpoU
VRIPIPVDDADDPRLSDFVGLSDPELRRRVEIDANFFVAESPHVVRRLVRSGRRVRAVLVTPVQHDALADDLRGIDAPVYVAPIEVLRRVVGFDLHRGAVASADRWPIPDAQVVLHDATRVVACERVNDHENLGVLFRSAAALGVDAILLDRECADPLYRRCVRVSIGTVLTLPWTRIDSLLDLRNCGFECVALTPSATAGDIGDVEWPARAAVLVGAEGPGLSETWLAQADQRIRIPMHNDVDSLNLASAAAIACYLSRR